MKATETHMIKLYLFNEVDTEEAEKLQNEIAEKYNSKVMDTELDIVDVQANFTTLEKEKSMFESENIDLKMRNERLEEYISDEDLKELEIKIIQSRVDHVFILNLLLLILVSHILNSPIAVYFLLGNFIVENIFPLDTSINPHPPS